MNLGEERDVLVDAQVAVQTELLRQVADGVGQPAMLADGIHAQHFDPAAVGTQQPADQPDRRRLAGAVRTDEAEHLAAFDRHRQLVDGRHGTVALGDGLE